MIVEIRVPKMNRRGLVVPEVPPPRARLGDRRLRGSARRADRRRAHQHGPDTGARTGVEQALQQGASAEDAASHASDDTQPTTDLNANADFRRHLARVLVRRALTEAGTT